MEESFFRNRLASHGLDVVVPGAPDREIIHRIILEELVLGRVLDSSRITCQEIVAQKQVDAVILGCTELPMLLTAQNCPFPVYDTTALHADAAVNFALA